MDRNGIVLDKLHCQLIYAWTCNDIKQLFDCFIDNPNPPTNGYALFLFSIMDIWGSIFRDNFADETYEHSAKNIKIFLSKLVELKPTEYKILDDRGHLSDGIVKQLRHNLVHNYGLYVIKSQIMRDHLNIDINSKQETINIQASNDRWHIDCKKLKKDMLVIIDNWMKAKGYLL